MERTISSEERIRRAEEIYQRRRNQNESGIRVSTSVNTKKEYKLYKKMAMQIVISLIIYLSFYLVKNSNYIFTESVINKTKEFLSYDINFEQLYYQIQDFYNSNVKSFFDNFDNNKNSESINDITNELTNENLESQYNEQEINNETNAEKVGIGGGEEDAIQIPEIIETSADEDVVELTQMEIDAEEIKENYSLIVPLNGIISSRYGPRTPTEIVSANHAGIDIAADAGTQFIASMEGIVTCISTEGGYGNHVYIQNGDVVTLYAHCQAIYVEEGETINQGEVIGEVGSTGNATGPHLHFEIRKEDRVVNPEYILSFD